MSPWFLILTGFFGAGLLFAGLTGTCGMATMLAYLPWNRVFRTPPGGARRGEGDDLVPSGGGVREPSGVGGARRHRLVQHDNAEVIKIEGIRVVLRVCVGLPTDIAFIRIAIGRNP